MSCQIPNQRARFGSQLYLRLTNAYLEWLSTLEVMLVSPGYALDRWLLHAAVRSGARKRLQPFVAKLAKMIGRLSFVGVALGFGALLVSPLFLIRLICERSRKSLIVLAVLLRSACCFAHSFV